MIKTTQDIQKIKQMVIEKVHPLRIILLGSSIRDLKKLNLLTVANLLFLYVVIQMPSPVLVIAQEQVDWNIWRELLMSFEKHSEDSREFVENISKNNKNQIVGKLAIVLVEQWDLQVCDPVFEQPYIVYIKKIDEIQSINKYVVPIVEICVNSGGVVDTLTFLKPIQDVGLRNQIENSIRQCLFRPKYENGRFVQSKMIINYRIEWK